MKRIKTAKKSMRVLIALLITLLCVNGAMMALTVIANAETNDNEGRTATIAAKTSPILTDSIAKNQAAVAAALAKAEADKAAADAAALMAAQAAKAATTKQTATTTKTTTTKTAATSTPAPSNTTQPTSTIQPAAPAPAASTDFGPLKSSVHATLMSAFDELEFKIVVNPNAAYLGYFSTSKHSIEMREASVGTFRHEMGHFLDVLRNMPSRSTEFGAIYSAEKGLYTGTNATYITKNAQEYFAQSYRNYLENASQLKAERPQTYEFIRAHVEGICDGDITRTYNQYSWAW